MINWIINIIKRCGAKSPQKNKNRVHFDDLKDLSDINESGEILIQSKHKVQTKHDFDAVVQYTTNSNYLTQAELLNAIEINIKFLTLLLYKLENTLYIDEYKKINEMLEQSNTCKSIVMSISNNQIFYKKTVDIIKKHTLTVGKLVKHINKLDIAGEL